MKKSYLYVIVGAGALLCASLTNCNCRRETRTELSDILHEDARVTSMQHSDAWKEQIRGGNGASLSIGEINRPEENRINFGGKIKFNVNNKEIYERFKEGDLVDVSYRENYKLTFQDLDGDGEKEQTGKTLKGYVFVDAQKKN